MKTKLKSMLSIAALAIAGFAGSLVATPAQANVNCPLWPTPTVPGSAYALNGHIYDCMPVPRNSAESQFQIDVRNRVNSAISDMTSDEKNKASANVTLHDKCDTFLHDKCDIQTVSLKLSVAKISVEGGEMYPENIRYGMN